jgi:hypothetical protein
MNVDKVLEVMLDMAPQLLPILNGNNPDGSVITCDGAIIETYDDSSEEERRWEMVDLKRDFVFRDVKTEEELRKAIAIYIPTAALREIQAGYDPALPPVIGNYFYALMYHASWKLHGMADQNERRAYADTLLECLSRIAPPKFATVPQKYFDAFKLGL